MNEKPAIEYDESCSDFGCQCCETWRTLLADIRREANASVSAAVGVVPEQEKTDGL